MKSRAARSGIGAFAVAFLLHVCAVAPAQAAGTASAKAPARNGVPATIVTDGAIIYTAPDFDAAVITQLPKGQKLRVSKGTAGDQARFHKVRVGNRIGYVADIDVSVEGAAPAGVASDEDDESSARPAKKNDRAAKRKKADRTKEARRRKSDREREKKAEADVNKNPMYFSRFVGLLVGFSEFKEGISGVDASTTFPIYGLKVTGPDVLLSGPVIDFNLALHYGAPTYYEPLSSIRPIGFVLFSDALFLIPFLNAQDAMIYMGLGPVLVLSKFSVLNAGRTQDLTSLSLGGAVSVGAGYRVGKVAARLEAKYVIEKQQYKSVLFALQSGF